MSNDRRPTQLSLSKFESSRQNIRFLFSTVSTEGIKFGSFFLRDFIKNLFEKTKSAVSFLKRFQSSLGFEHDTLNQFSQRLNTSRIVLSFFRLNHSNWMSDM